MKTCVLINLTLFITVLGNVEGLVSTNRRDVNRLIAKMYRHSPLVILFDEKNERLASELSSWNANQQRVLLFSLEKTGIFLEHHVHQVLTTSTSIEDIRTCLNFVVACSDCLFEVLHIVSEWGDAIGKQAMRHFSTWLFITQKRDNDPATPLDNVAWLLYNLTERVACCGFVQKGSASWKQSLVTLLWTPEGRKWSGVSSSKTTDESIFHRVFPNIQRGLNGRCLQISTLQWVPESIRRVVNGTVTYVGASIDVLTSLSEMFNFTFKVTEPPDGSWGVQLENGSWTGIIGMLERQETDMSGSPYSYTADRAQVMDFTPPTGPTEFVVIYTKKKDTFYFWKFLVHGFSWEVYVCGAVIFVCTVPLYLSILYFHEHLSTTEPILIFTKIALRQDVSGYLEPRASSERVLLFSWAFYCFLITAIYSGSLVASATVDRLEVPFETLEDLVEQNEYTVSVFDGYVALEVIKNSKLVVYQKLYTKMRNHILKTTSNYLTDGLNLVLHESHALLSDLNMFQAMSANSCELSVMKERLFYSPASYGFPQHSPLRKLFIERWMLDTGVFQENQRVWQDAPKRCGLKTEVSSNKLELKHLTTLFVVCICGIVLGGVTLMQERRRWRRNPDL